MPAVSARAKPSSSRTGRTTAARAARRRSPASRRRAPAVTKAAQAPRNARSPKAARPKARTPRPRTEPSAIRYAVVGLGYIAQVAVLPAFAHARSNCELVALVSDDPTKLRSARPPSTASTRLYGYDDYDALLASGDVDAVYIALPNTDAPRLHRARGARRASTCSARSRWPSPPQDCEAMIRACERARREADDRLPPALRARQPRAPSRSSRSRQARRAAHLRLASSRCTCEPGNIRLQRGAGRRHALRHRHLLPQRRARRSSAPSPIEVFGLQRRGRDRALPRGATR